MNFSRAAGGFLRCIGMLAAATTLAGCQQNVSHPHYRETLSVNVGGQIVEKSSVIGLKQWVEQTIDSGGMFKEDPLGEPPAVDLGGGRILFATWLCKEEYEYVAHRPSDIAGLAWLGYPYPGTGQHAPGDTHRRCILPMLVTFKNLSDPGTIEAVDPDNPSETLGNDVRSISIISEVTDDPLTKGETEKYLPWLASNYLPWNGLDGRSNHGSRVIPGPAMTLDHAMSAWAFRGY